MGKTIRMADDIKKEHSAYEDIEGNSWVLSVKARC